VVSDLQSESFVGQKIEKGTAEVVIARQFNPFQDPKALQKKFTDFVRKNDLQISFDGAGVKLIGRCPIRTAEETDFDAITEVGTNSNEDAFLTAGKILLIRKNQSNYCVKILVESVTE